MDPATGLLSSTSLMVNYGVLVVWTASLSYYQFKYWTEMKKVIENNTIAVTKVYDALDDCKRRQI